VITNLKISRFRHKIFEKILIFDVPIPNSKIIETSKYFSNKVPSTSTSQLFRATIFCDWIAPTIQKKFFRKKNIIVKTKHSLLRSESKKYEQ